MVVISYHSSILVLGSIYPSQTKSFKMSESPPDILPELGVYSIRWYILAIFSLLSMFQCSIWNTWGPVEKVAKVVFTSWSNQTISLFANWANFVTFPFLIPSIYLAEKSLRGCVVCAAALMVVGKSYPFSCWLFLFTIQEHCPDVLLLSPTYPRSCSPSPATSALSSMVWLASSSAPLLQQSLPLGSLQMRE